MLNKHDIYFSYVYAAYLVGPCARFSEFLLIRIYIRRFNQRANGIA
jgi:hypothetical protein